MDSPEKSALARQIRQSKPVRRILSLDGGGVRGVFAIEILARIEELLRLKTGNQSAVLSDYFDFVGGTSTGAIIATCVSWGMPMAQIRQFYQEKAREIFANAAWYLRYKHKFVAHNITRLLCEQFVDDDGQEALLGTSKLKTVLLVAMQNVSTGSAWPVTNNPFAKYNDPYSSPDSNLRIPLWKLVRASTAAPTFFEPETIVMGAKGAEKQFVFVDGALTPYNNPSLISFLTAALPCYRIEWPTGEHKLLVVSVGNGRSRTGDALFLSKGMTLLYAARQVPKALMDGMSTQQDTLCRVLGKCLHGETIDSEVGDLIDQQVVPEKRFSYVRYNKTFTAEEIAEIRRISGSGFELDNLRLMDILTARGAAYARQCVNETHLI